MDSLSQIVLGAAVGEAVLGKKVGNKALLWGAIGGTIPDLDVLPGHFLDTVSRLDLHRGFSHSLVFAILMAPVLGFFISRIYKKKKEADWWSWTQLMFWAIVTHPLLDIFTTWGTQFFWPLDWRIALESVFVIDPLYTLPLLLASVLVLFMKRSNPKRASINKIGLLLSSSYLLYSLFVKLHVNGVFEDSLLREKRAFMRFNTRPSPFNTLLWTCNVETKDAFLIGYYSLLDEDKEIDFYRFSKNHELLMPYRNNPDIERLLFLTKGYYILSEQDGVLEMNDLRFGLTEGFDKGKGDFVFSYKIQQSSEGLSIEQKPNNFEGMDRVLQKLGQRIKGKKSF